MRDRSLHWRGHEIPDQSGRHVVVTGATGGLGLECTRRLALAGATVTMAVRSPAKARELSRGWAGDVPGRVEVAHLDVSSLASIREFADTVERVDVVVNNAGVMGVPPSRTVDGFEMQMGTNHLGHFALTNLLLPRMTDRVVAIGSAAHHNASLDVDDLNFARRPYRRYGAYAQSKLANLLMVSELQRRLTASGSTLRAVAAHPGYSATGIGDGTGLKAFTGIYALGNRLVGMVPSRGVLPVMFVATRDVPGNSYVGPHRLLEMNGWPVQVGRSALASDPDLAKELWVRCEELTGVTCPLPSG